MSGGQLEGVANACRTAGAWQRLLVMERSALAWEAGRTAGVPQGLRRLLVAGEAVAGRGADTAKQKAGGQCPAGTDVAGKAGAGMGGLQGSWCA